MKKWKKWLIGGFIGLLLLGGGGAAVSYKYVNYNSRDINVYEMYNQSVVLLTFGEYGHGSGVVVAPDRILTARHCLLDVEEITVNLHDGSQYIATEFILDEEHDLALIIVDIPDIRILPMDFSEINVGDRVLGTGAPLDREFFGTISFGRITGTNRKVWYDEWHGGFTIDAFCALGNSGGAIIRDGKVIGLCVGGPNNAGTSLVVCMPVTSLDEAILDRINEVLHAD